MDKPSTLEEIYGQQLFWSQRRDNAEKRRQAAEKTIERCYKHLGGRTMVEQLRDLLAPQFPDHDLDVLGPFGLSHEMSIHANVPAPDTRRGYETVGSLSFRPHDEYEGTGRDMHVVGRRLKLVDRSYDSGEYGPNTIGGMNGFNYREVDLPDTVDGVAELLRASIDGIPIVNGVVVEPLPTTGTRTVDGINDDGIIAKIDALIDDELFGGEDVRERARRTV